MSRFQHSIATALVAGALSLAAAAPVFSQEPAGRTTLIELTPHLAVNDAAERIEAMEYPIAIDILDTFLANEPMPPPEAYYLLGVAHYQLMDYAKALPAAERAATMASDAPASWLELLVTLYKHNNDSVSALPWLERLVELTPGNKTYWLELSLAYERTGNWDKSLATMRLAQGAGLLTDDADFRRLADLLLHQGIPQQAAEVLEQAMATRQVRADEASYTKLGTAWFTAGEVDKAVMPLENAARAASSGDAYVRLAIVHVQREDWAAAIAALHAGFGRGALTDTGRANLLMGIALYAQGKFAEARDWFTMATESADHRQPANEYIAAIDQRLRAVPAL
jgi:tetratricopeptide (TPR) repeat protein